MTRPFAIALGALVLFGGLVDCARRESSPAESYARDTDALKRGRRLFQGACGAYCHGLRPGKRDAPDLFDCAWIHGGDDGDLFRVIREGVKGTQMPAFAGRLPEGDDDVWKVVAFIRSRSRCAAWD